MPLFESTITVEGWSRHFTSIPTVIGNGSGHSKKEAEHRAAINALAQYRDLGDMSWPRMTLPTEKCKP